MQKHLLLGLEAIGLGAIDAGISGVYAYPGTPSTEITEYIQKNALAVKRDIHRKWSANEKTAMEAALGMSYAGKRALVCMKHVGLNVAADAFINSAITGANGGLVVTVADDPSMHSSQNEQDSRFYGAFAQIPILEPSNQQEAYEMARAGFDLSEKYGVPVMLRITTRLAHSRSGVETSPPIDENKMKLPDDPMQFMLLPVYARPKYQKLLKAQATFLKASNESAYNKYFSGEDKSLGIICCGITINYLNEVFTRGCPYPHIKISQYPVPDKLIKRLEKECEELLVIEEGYPLVEERVKDFFGKGIQLKGRLDGTLPRSGELNPDIVSRAFGIEPRIGREIPSIVTKRTPSLCSGCGHQITFFALNEAMKEFGRSHVFSDIGCYTLGVLPPYESLVTCVDMGASITMAKGAADAGFFPAVAVIGDSTFTHSGMTGLIDTVNAKSNITVIICDNESVAMTGAQESAATGKIEEICKAIGVDQAHIRVVVPIKKNQETIVKMIREEIDFNGVSVIIPRRQCIQRALRLKNEAKK